MSWPRFSISAASAAVLALALAWGSACKSDISKEREEAAKRVTADSTDDATQPIVDEDYRFRIEWPGEGWKLLREQEAKNLIPDAVAAAVSGNRFAGLIVEQAPGATTTAMLDLVVENFSAEDVVILSREPLQYASKDAERIVLEGTRMGTRFRYVIVAFVHQEHFFQLLAWGISEKTKVEDFTPFFDSFSLLPGSISPRKKREVITRDVQGTGWIVRDGEFRSAVAGLEAIPRDGWRVVVGSELEEMNQEAHVGLVRGDPEAYIVLLLERVEPGAREAFLADRRRELADALGTTAEEMPVSARFAGADLQLWRHHAGLLHFLHGVQIHGDLGVQVLAWHMAGLGERALPQIHEGLASFTWLEPTARAELREHLIRAPDPQNAVGSGWAIRGGTYRDFQHRFTWKAPGGFWRMEGGEKARAAFVGGVLAVEELELGIHGVVFVGDASEGGVEDWRTHVESLWDIEVDERTVGPASDGRPMGRTLGKTDLAGTPYAFELGYTVHDGVGIAVSAWAPGKLQKSHPGALSRVVDSLHVLDALPELESGPRFSDHRLGFALSPPAGYTLRDDTPEHVAATARMLLWSKGKSQIQVMALCVLGQGQDEDWFEGFIEQTVRQAFVTSVGSGSTTRTKTELAGRPARQFTWESLRERVDSQFFTERRTLYVLTLINVEPELAEDVRNSFTVLD